MDSCLSHESIIAKQVPVERTTAGSQFCRLEVAENVTGILCAKRVKRTRLDKKLKNSLGSHRQKSKRILTHSFNLLPKHLFSQPLTRKNKTPCFCTKCDYVYWFDQNWRWPYLHWYLLLAFDPSRVIIFSYRKKKKRLMYECECECVYMCLMCVSTIWKKRGGLNVFRKALESYCLSMEFRVAVSRYSVE